MSDRVSPYFIAFIAIVVWGATPAVTQIAVTKIDPATASLNLLVRSE
jgi:hypothetical protein